MPQMIKKAPINDDWTRAPLPVQPQPVMSPEEELMKRVMAIKAGLSPATPEVANPRIAQADALEREATTPKPQPRGTGQELLYGAVQGLRGFAHPQGYVGMKQQDLANERVVTQDKLARVKDLRAQANTEEDNARAKRQEDLARTNAAVGMVKEEDDERQRKVDNLRADRPKFTTINAPGNAPTIFGTVNPIDASFTKTGQTAAGVDKSPVPSDDDVAYDDWLKTPEYNKTYPQNRAGYLKWKGDQTTNRQALNYDRGEGDRQFTQERQLNQEFNQAASMDMQRLQSYRNLKNLGSDLSGADQIAVLYNFIRLMDPNRVSEGELALAQGGSQTAVEKMKAEFNRIYGSANVFSPEGAKQLLGAADKMAGGIQRSLANTLKRYEDDAERYGLKRESMGRSARELLTPPNDGVPTAGTKIRVRRKADGKTGTIIETDFDPAKYDKI